VKPEAPPAAPPNSSAPTEGESPAVLDFREFEPATAADWRKAAESFLKGAPFEKKLITRTPEGVALQPIYSAPDSDETPAGARPPRFGGLIAQEISAAEAKDFNPALRADLMAGQNTTPLPLDTATRRAQDPGEAAPDEIGRDGLSFAVLQDLRAALDGVDLAAAPPFVWAGASALPFLGLVGALAEERTCRAADWGGAILADPLTEWAREGVPDLGLPDAYAEMAACLRWAEMRMPKLRVIGIQAHLWAEAGGSAVDELACAIATGAAYLREMVGRGIDVDMAAARMVFSFSLGSQIFMQIAKLRAARQLWARVAAAFGGDAGAAPMAIHGRSSGFAKSSLDPHANLLRITGDAFAGMVAGVESLHLSAFDETLRMPDAFSRRLARNVQIILSEECGLADVADAAGGSWYVEKLTAELAGKAWTRFQEIEAVGGMAAALRGGSPQRAAAEAGEARFAALASGRESLVGVNLSANPKEEARAVSTEDRTAFRSDRVTTVAKIAEAVSNPGRIRISHVPGAIEAFLSGWTIGQVRRSLPRGSAAEPAIERIQPRRVASGFEALRARAADWAKTAGQPPAAWLATFGPPRQHRARADFSSAFLACGGFEVRSGRSEHAIEDAVNDAIASGAPVVVICSTDDTYPGIVPVFTSLLKARAPSVHILVAGAPGDQEAAYREAGVDDFIHLGVNRLAFLENLLTTLNPVVK